MPSVSIAQHRMMEAAKHDPRVARRLGISRGVAEEFTSADTSKHLADLPEKVDHKAQGGIIRCPHCGKHHYADGGEVRTYEAPEDSDLGQKREAELPDERLDVYQGENVKREEERKRRDEDERPAGLFAGGDVDRPFDRDHEESLRVGRETDRYSRQVKHGAFADHLARRRQMKRGGMIPRR